MVTEYGMSERLGARKFGTGQGEVFLGRDMGHERDYSEEIAAAIDEEVRRLSSRRTTRRGRSWSSTATCSTTWCSSSWRRRPSPSDQVLQIFAPVVVREHASVLRAATASGCRPTVRRS